MLEVHLLPLTPEHESSKTSVKKNEQAYMLLVVSTSVCTRSVQFAELRKQILILHCHKVHNQVVDS